MSSPNAPRMLAYDIEASNLSAGFGIILCCGFREVGRGRTEVLSLHDYDEADPIKAEKLLLKDMSKRLLDSDCWIAHFGKYFDGYFVNSRLLYHKLPTLPTNFPLVDTWRVMRNSLKLRNNRLATLQDFLGLKSSKTPITAEAWIRALAGQERAMREVINHCRKDVDVLVEAYLRLRPLINEHPNHRLFNDNAGCPLCGSHKVQYRGYHRTVTRAYRRVQCQECGKWSREAKPVKIVSTLR